MPALFAVGGEALAGLFAGGAAEGAALGGAELGAGALGGAELGGAALGGAEGAGLGGAVAGSTLGGGLAAEGGGALGFAGLPAAEAAVNPLASFGSSALGFADAAPGASTLAGGGTFDVTGAGGAFGSASPGFTGGSLTSGGTADLTGAATIGGNAAAPGASPAASGSIFDKLVAGATNSVTSNPIGTALGAGALGYNIYKGSQTDPLVKQLQSSAGSLNAQGQQLQAYLQSGTLPAGLQAQVQQANAAAKARVIANHAHNGQSTDPSQNSALAQELNSIDQQSTIQIATIGQQLLTTGINETGLSDQLYAQLIGLDRQQSANTGAAIANFAAALNGGRAQQPAQQQQRTI